MKILILFILILVFLMLRYNPRLDKIVIGTHELLIMWYNKDIKGKIRDYIILF